MAEVNCVPLSEVSCTRTPHLEIQPATRVSAQGTAAMSRMGSASSQREDQRTTVNRYLLRWQGAYNVHVDVGERSGRDGDRLHRRRVQSGNLGSLTLLEVRDPCGHVAVETSPHDPGDNQLLGGPRAGMG